jgi:multidrug efflux system membrane fusion protein
MPEDTVEVKPPHVRPDYQAPPEGPKPARSPIVRILVWLVILAAFALLFWVVWHHKPAQSVAMGGRRGVFGGPVTVTTVTAKKGEIGVYLQSIGTVTPIYTDTITSQATGLITQVNYREGQIVHKGDPLIQIDPRFYSAQVLNAEGTLARDEGLLAQGRMDLERYKTAWARNAIAKQVLDDQEKLVQQQEGTVKADQGTLELDKVELSYCNIFAPISGRVGLRLVDPGNVVQANSTTPLVVITQLQPITVVFTIPEDNVPEVQAQLHKGRFLPVDAFDRNDQNKLSSGKLLTLDNQIDTTTGTLKLRAVFDNRDNTLFPNLFVNARLLVKTLSGVTLIPSYTIQHNGDTSFVFMVQDGEAHIHDVTPGVTSNGMTQVQGVSPGDVIADSSFEKLTDGSKVIISNKPILPEITSPVWRSRPAP